MQLKKDKKKDRRGEVEKNRDEIQVSREIKRGNTEKSEEKEKERIKKKREKKTREG
jgi:hypothetical protein